MTLIALSETWGTSAPDGDADAGLRPGFVWTVLPRHGRRPARFYGRALLFADNCAAAPACWSSVKVYELYEGGFGVGVRHGAAGNDIPDFQDAWQASSAAAVLATLRGHTASDRMPPGFGVGLHAPWEQLLCAMFGTGPAP